MEERFINLICVASALAIVVLAFWAISVIVWRYWR